MRLHQTKLLGLLLALACSSARAYDWDSSVDITLHIPHFGYAPPVLVSDDASGAYVATSWPSWPGSRGDLHVTAWVRSRYLHLYVEPYVIISGWNFRAFVGGAVLKALVPIGDLRVGFYHHSAHNFAVVTNGLGEGIDLSGLEASYIISLGHTLQVQPYLRSYWSRHASPYVFTADTRLSDMSSIGQTPFEIGLSAKLQYYWLAADCDHSLAAATDVGVVSYRSVCSATTTQLSELLLGPAGKQLDVGFYSTIGVNLSRTAEFGNSNVVIGTQLVLHLMRRDR